MISKKIDAEDRCRHLMMAELDGEISSEEKEELQKLLQQFPNLKEELQSFTQLKEVTDTMALKTPDPEIWETYWYNIYNRIERSLAWIILTIGAGILIIYGLGQASFNIWHDPKISPVVKVGIFGAVLGVFLLLISDLREKLFLRRQERYKEVQR